MPTLLPYSPGTYSPGKYSPGTYSPGVQSPGEDGPGPASPGPQAHLAEAPGLWPGPFTSLVIAERPSGPVFAGRRVRLRPLRPDTFVPLLGWPSRIAIALLSVGFVASLASFLQWWLRPEHRTSWAALVVNTALVLYVAWQPIAFLFAMNRLRRVNPRLPVPALRVAFVVTKAPSEPWPVARVTLESMLRQNFPYPYDVWICDEDPSPEVLDWCAGNRVCVSTRKDQPAYHQPHWPRRTRCKEGNLAWFYDHWGYRHYDVVAQLDCDHVPAAGYLSEMVRPFADPAIGYVAAPSICDANAKTSWAARGRLHQEATFHGPFQLGHHGLAPVCIGSHYAVRTRAVAEIGGIGPELAEDFSTSFLLTSAGWQGAFAHRAHARGDGPLTFAAMVTQEFQWCRSMVTVLLGLAPRHLSRLPLTLRFRFLYQLTYYPLLAVAMVGGLLLPVFAALTGYEWMRVDYPGFVLRWWTLYLWLIAAGLLLRFHNLFRPASAPPTSWELSLYLLTRWVWTVWGVIAATRSVLGGKVVGFRVTPKTRDGLEPIPLRVVLPYVLVAVGNATAALVGRWFPAGGRPASGYLLLSLLAALAFATVGLIVPLLHAREMATVNGTRFGAAVRATAAGPITVALLGWLPVLAGVVCCADQVPALL